MNRQALLELQKRVAAQKAAEERPKFNAEAYFFTKQGEFFNLTSKNRARVACCSRRAGKTIGMIGDILRLALGKKKARILYITLTRANCLEIIWPDLLGTIEQFQIPVKVDNTRLAITFEETGSVFSCAGAKDEREIGKFRGRKLDRVYIDEAQNFPAYIAKMIKEDIMPTLRDTRGEIIVTGTPGPLKRGFFYDIVHNGKWDSRTWTAFDNPHMHDPANGKDLEKTLAEEREVSNIDPNDPAYIRETYGTWFEDLNALVFKFDAKKNVYKTAPNNLTYIIGFDIGFNDADAIAVVGYNHSDGKIYLVEEKVQAKQDITSLVEQVKHLKAKYDPVKIVMDAGALGKKIQEEINARHGIYVEAAEKQRKLEFIELLNDDLKRARFQAFEGSRFEEDCYQEQWDRNSDPAKPTIDKSFHSDINMAVLYSWRECRHYFQETVVTKPKSGTDAWADAEFERTIEEIERKRSGHNHDDTIDMSDFEDIYRD